jgi:glycosyltransferase involved in cell wall biosynthesis
MGRGPQNFLDRVNKSLSKLDLPKHVIINPHPHSLGLLSNHESIKVGRLDGASYYETSPENLFNLIYQRRNRKIQVLKKIPFKVAIFLRPFINDYLNRSNRAILNKSDVIIYQSNFSKKMQDKFLFPTSKLNKTILNGIPTEIFYPQKNSSNKNLNIVITASFRLHKRLQDAIDLINQIALKYKSVRLHVIGDMDNLTRDLISTKNTMNCRFYGRVSPDQLPLMYRNFDLGISPSLFDPCPNSVVEMIGCGLPVISTTQSGASELIKFNDLLVEEDCDLNYLELQTAEKIPKINLDAWESTVELILSQKNHYCELMQNRIEEDLNINLTAERYANLIWECYHSKN